MKNSFHVHWYKSLDDLFKNFENLSDGKSFIFFLIKMEKITFFTIFHEDLNCLFLSFNLVVINFNKILMGEFFHDFDFFLWLLKVERINSCSFESIFFSFLIFNQIHTSKAALSEFGNDWIVFTLRHGAKIFGFHELDFFLQNNLRIKIVYFINRWYLISQFDLNNNN